MVCSYYRATEAELEEYLKAVDFLTIEERYRLEKQVTQLAQQSKEENYMIKGQLLEYPHHYYFGFKRVPFTIN